MVVGTGRSPSRLSVTGALCTAVFSRYIQARSYGGGGLRLHGPLIFDDGILANLLIFSSITSKFRHSPPLDPMGTPFAHSKYVTVYVYIYSYRYVKYIGRA